ncbi:ABC transporter permease [Clostridiaceae bacterium M8S5]|nr:ABC transporter permease [Clostridiaceae bacterium M8S5]
MLKYILKRLVLIAITLFLVLTITFTILQILPGSPFKNPKIPKAEMERLEELYGLNDPIYVQYFRYIEDIITDFDFGISFKYRNQKVTDMLFTRIPYTIKIGSLALSFGVVVGIFFGIIAAIKRNTVWDHVCTILAVIGVSIPSFIFAALTQNFFAFKWGIFPSVYSKADISAGITGSDEFYSMILPALSMAIFVIATTMRYTRSELAEVLGSEYILLAKAKGLSDRKVILKHAIRNAMIPVITIVGPMTIMLISGGTVMEKFFGVPGLAQTLISAIQTRDYFLISGIGFTYSAIYVIVILIIDILYGFIDPRIRLAGVKND